MTDDLKRLRLDEKWSVVFDPADNDRPLFIERYGEPAGVPTAIFGLNAGVAMFYAIRERDAKITDLEARLAAAEAGEDALAEAGGKFHRACNAAWAAGEPSHKVRTMLDEADRFGVALAAYEARRKG